MGDGMKNALVDLLNLLIAVMAKIPDIIARFSNFSTSTVAQSIQNYSVIIATTLMVVFFIIDFAGKCINPDWITLPNICLFFAKAIAFKFVVSNSGDILKIFYDIAQVIFKEIESLTTGSAFTVDVGLNDLITTIKGLGNGLDSVLVLIMYGLLVFLIALILLGTMGFILGTLISRVLEIYVYQAIAPIPIATLVSDGNSSIGKRFLQNYAAVCFQSSVILLLIMLFNDVIRIILTDDLFKEFKFIGIIFSYICLATLVSKSGSISKALVGL